MILGFTYPPRRANSRFEIGSRPDCDDGGESLAAVIVIRFLPAAGDVARRRAYQ
jgi:hypothetical protein